MDQACRHRILKQTLPAAGAFSICGLHRSPLAPWRNTIMTMQAVRAPLSHPVDIADLKPTQMTVGLKEVETRAAKMKALAQQDNNKLVRKHVIPVVKGPKDNFYVIDHHHLCRAMLLAGLSQVSVVVVLNLARLDKDAFWVFMDNRGLVHPFDEDGKRCAYSDIPKSIEDMIDDPFRSLAGALRRKGGYAKDTTPFSEFLWADYLRRQIKAKDVDKDFAGTLETALALAKKREADHLPGWCGPVEEEG
jgi:hypothetical protein